jgi:hypothetical protein
MYRDGRMNRREFMAAMGALGVTATAAGGLMTSASALSGSVRRRMRLLDTTSTHW